MLVALFFLVVSSARQRHILYFFVGSIVIIGSCVGTLGLILQQDSLFGFPIRGPAPVHVGHPGISLVFVNHSNFAGFLELAAWVCLGAAMAQRGARAVLLGCLGLYMLVAIVFSLSRGGILATAGALIFVFFMASRLKQQRRRVRWLIAGLLGLLALAVAALAPEPVIARLSTLENPLEEGRFRFVAWQDGMSQLADRPWLGSGPGTYELVSARFQSEETGSFVVDHAHNTYIERAAELGWVGAASYLILGGGFFLVCLQGLGTATDPALQAIGLGALTGCFSLLVHELVDFQFAVPSSAILFTVVAAIAVASTTRRRDGRLEVTIPHRWRWLAVASTIIAALALQVVNALPWAADSFHRQALAHQRDEAFEPAAEALEAAAMLEPANAEHAAAMGTLIKTRARQAGQEQKETLLEALGHYQRAAALAPLAAHHQTRLGMLLLQLGSAEEAGLALQRAVDLAPVRAHTHFDLAGFLIRQGEVQKACNAFRRCLELDRDGKFLPSVLDELERFEIAYEVRKSVVPSTARARAVFSRFLHDRGHTEEAIMELARAHVHEPTSDRALAHLGALRRQGWADEALAAYHHYHRRYPEQWHLTRETVLALEAGGRGEQALEIVKGVVAEDPLRVEPSLLLSQILQRLGRTAEAVAQLEDSLRVLPGEVQLYLETARILEMMRRPEDALSILGQGLEHLPDKAKIHYRQGLVLRHLARHEEALAAFKRSVRLVPQNLDYRFQLGVQYEELGLLQEGIEQWRKALSISPTHSASLHALARVRERLGMGAPKSGEGQP